MKKLLVLCVIALGCAFASPRFHAGDRVRVVSGFYAGCHNGLLLSARNAGTTSVYRISELCCGGTCLATIVEIYEADLALDL